MLPQAARRAHIVRRDGERDRVGVQGQRRMPASIGLRVPLSFGRQAWQYLDGWAPRTGKLAAFATDDGWRYALHVAFAREVEASRPAAAAVGASPGGGANGPMPAAGQRDAAAHAAAQLAASAERMPSAAERRGENALEPGGFAPIGFERAARCGLTVAGGTGPPPSRTLRRSTSCDRMMVLFLQPDRRPCRLPLRPSSVPAN